MALYRFVSLCKLQDCRQPFYGGSFFDHEGMPYCETHYHAKRGSLCAGCSKPITGRCITAMFRKFHPEHFVCAFCLKQLNKGENDARKCSMSRSIKTFILPQARSRSRMTSHTVTDASTSCSARNPRWRRMSVFVKKYFNHFNHPQNRFYCFLIHDWWPASPHRNTTHHLNYHNVNSLSWMIPNRVSNDSPL